MVKNPECQAKELELDSVGNRSHWRILSRGGFCFYLCFRKSTVVWVERGELGGHDHRSLQNEQPDLGTRGDVGPLLTSMMVSQSLMCSLRSY